jgi:hypothetical protein
MFFPGFRITQWARLCLFGLTCFLLCFACDPSQLALAQSRTVAQPTPHDNFSAVGIGTGTRPIAGLWQFHLGDDAQWAQPAFNDSAWEQLPADRPWGDAGHPGYSGYAWYRRQIELDPASKQPLGFYLPPLNSVAEVYWNGTKVGGIGVMPPHLHWYYNPQPVAISLPSEPGAKAGMLAVRLWERPLGSNDAPDDGGFQGAPLIGYRALIVKTADGWVEHRLRARAVGYSALLVFFLAGVAALVLWVRSPSQYVLLCFGLFFSIYALDVASRQFLTISWTAAVATSQTVGSGPRYATLFLLLLLADLARRPGWRGFRFWARACVVFSAIYLMGGLLSMWEALSITSPHFALVRFLDTSTEIISDVTVLFTVVLLAACFLLSRPTLPRLLFMAALALDITLQNLTGLLTEHFTRIEPIRAFMQHPLLQIYGSNFSVFVASKLLLLLTIVYAVWDQLSHQLARQRFVAGELKAAQEVQQVLVPAAAERDAIGFAVESVYRPASEVGGDFFQIIPLAGR